MSDEQSRKIERYLDGEMNQEEIKAFKLSLKTDKKLQRKLKTQEEIRKALKEEDIMQLRELMGKTMQQPVKKRFSVHKIAIIFLPLLILGGWLLNHFTSETTADLFQAYYSPYESISSSRSASWYSFENESIWNAMQAYSKKQYDEAAEIFASIETHEIDNPDIQLQKACSFLQSNREQEAIKILKKIAKSKHPLFAQKAKWYLALAFLKNDQIEEAKVILTEISHSNHYKQKEAIELKEKLE